MLSIKLSSSTIQFKCKEKDKQAQHQHLHSSCTACVQQQREMAMAVRAMAAKPTTPSPSSSPAKLLPPKPQLKLPSLSLPTSTTLSLIALFSPPYEARAVALPKDQIVSSLTEVEKTIDQVQEASSGFFYVAQQVFDIVTEALKPAVPVLQRAGEEALKITSPVVSEASKKAQEAMQSSGIDTEPVMTAAKTVADVAQQTTKVIEGAKPIASTAVQSISTTEPTVIVATAGALVLTYLVVPPLWSVISFNLRGYKGDLTPAQALDSISTKNHVLIDIRSEKDKDNIGIPRLPSSAKNLMIAIPLEDFPSKLRGLIRNVKKVEAEIAALKISYLKKINKGSNIVILDSYADSAKIVARTLTSLGFKNCWVVADGFSGRNGWLQSRLGTDTYNFSFVDVLSPSQVVRRFGTTGVQSGRKLLPGSK